MFLFATILFVILSSLYDAVFWNGLEYPDMGAFSSKKQRIWWLRSLDCACLNHVKPSPNSTTNPRVLKKFCRASFGSTQTLAACRHLWHTGHRPRLVEPFSKVENLDIRKENSWKLSASHLNLVVFPDLNYAGSVHDLAWYGQKEMSHRGAV